MSDFAAQDDRGPPVQVRGLKRAKFKRDLLGRKVAPRGGAWIETFKALEVQRNVHVAPRAGA